MISEQTEVNINDKYFRHSILKAHNYKCFYTGELLKAKDFEIDHIVPIFADGKNFVYNLVPCNKKINRRKSKKFDSFICEKLIHLNKLLFVDSVIKIYNKNSKDAIIEKINLGLVKKNSLYEKMGYYKLLIFLIFKRKEIGISQYELAKNIGIDRRKIIYIENGTNIDLETLLLYADIMSIDIKFNFEIN